MIPSYAIYLLFFPTIVPMAMPMPCLGGGGQDWTWQAVRTAAARKDTENRHCQARKKVGWAGGRQWARAAGSRRKEGRGEKTGNEKAWHAHWRRLSVRGSPVTLALAWHKWWLWVLPLSHLFLLSSLSSLDPLPLPLLGIQSNKSSWNYGQF